MASGTPLKTYDLREVFLVIGGQRIRGFGPDDVIEFEHNADLAEHTVGADGEVTIARSNDASMMCTITVMETSTAYKALGDQLDEQNLEQSIQRRAFLMRDSISGEEISDDFCAFLTRPIPSKNRGPGTRSFKLLLPNGARGFLMGPNNTI